MESVVIGSIWDTASEVCDLIVTLQTILNPERKKVLFNSFLEGFDGADAPTRENKLLKAYMGCLPDLYAAFMEAKNNGKLAHHVGEGPEIATKTFQVLHLEIEETLLFFIVFAGPSRALTAVTELANFPAQDPTFQALQLRVLMRAFNLLNPAPSTQVAIEVLEKLINFVLDHCMPEALFSYVSRILQWVSDPAVTRKQRISICRLLVKVLEAKPDSGGDSLVVLRRLIADYDAELKNGSNSSGKNTPSNRTAHKKKGKGSKNKPTANTTNVSPQIIEAAALLAVLSLRLREVVLFDSLVASPSIQKLQKSPEHAGLWPVLNVFHQGSMEAFDALPDKVFLNYDLDRQELRRKLSMVVVCAMAVDANGGIQSNSRSIKLADIAKTLGVDEEEAECVAVRAVGAQLIDGHMDQLCGELKVANGIQRSFTKTHWTLLQQRIVSLHRTITEVLDNLL